jgi:hypothetical protein
MYRGKTISSLVYAIGNFPLEHHAIANEARLLYLAMTRSTEYFDLIAIGIQFL